MKKIFLIVILICYSNFAFSCDIFERICDKFFHKPSIELSINPKVIDEILYKNISFQHSLIKPKEIKKAQIISFIPPFDVKIMKWELEVEFTTIKCPSREISFYPGDDNLQKRAFYVFFEDLLKSCKSRKIKWNNDAPPLVKNKNNKFIMNEYSEVQKYPEYKFSIDIRSKKNVPVTISGKVILLSYMEEILYGRLICHDTLRLY